MILTLLLVVPIIGAVSLIFLPRENKQLINWFAFAFTLVNFAISLPLYFLYDSTPVSEGYRFALKVAWIPSLNIYYHIGIDGLSLFLILLTTFLSAISVLSSWSAIDEQVKEYMALMLLLETAVIGVFISLDLFLFYLFWEASLIPMALLIGRWGGKDRIYASIKFIIYTMAGSALMLVAALVVYTWGDGVNPTSDLPTLVAHSHLISEDMQKLLFFAFILAFSVKVPLFPLHTWLPAAHVQAPTAGSIILAGVLLKLGTYSMMRFAIPLFPKAVAFWSPLLVTLAVIGILYGALVALVQDDVKKLVAYSSVAHMGFVVLGIFVMDQNGTMSQQAMSAAVLQMVNHGLSTGMLFFLVGVLYERRHTRDFSQYGGIWVKVPVFGTFFILAAFSSVGLPGLNGFVGEFLILMGTFSRNPIAALFATFGIVLAAWYILTAVRKILFGPLNPANNDLTDMTPREIGISLAFIIPCFVIGFFPNFLFEIINPSTENLASLIDTAMLIVSK
ncbi:NADH-quinone oxidoreductase subunit M [Anaerolineales bacterium HSG6]|nr:NADH-quinone oxidoreductase subunit M [Anaerolineales bacterium HSG6]MDM8530095.1 NADH-quinone oxidoreductase subunit M [Anaerolineales bacterium HSG25]